MLKNAVYCKTSKNWDMEMRDTENNYNNKCSINGTVWFYMAEMCSKDAVGMANCIDSDQTATFRAV